MPNEIKLNTKELRDLEKFILTRVEAIIFKEHRRPSGLEKVEGGLLVEDKTGDLRRKLKANKNFVKQTKNGSFEITLNMVPYFKYLDDERKIERYNWYFTEAIFDDDKIRKKLRELMEGAAKRTIIKVISEEGSKNP